jgi:3',5'-cyclic AMP phosphodiesterase CpdA
MTSPAVRLVHFSDVHLTARRLGWRPGDLATKRVSGWVNMRLLGRARRFRHAPQLVAAMMRRIRDTPPDGLVFSGDATKLGFPTEFARAAECLGVNDPSLPPAVAVPGNHDAYTPSTAGLFEATFAPWQRGLRVAQHAYPFARQVGPVWLIAVSSATPNRFALDASGEVGDDQLDRLRELSGQLAPGVRVLVTHYPLRTETGTLEKRLRILRDQSAAVRVAADCKIALWLHGHIHRPYVRGAGDGVPFPMICAGSCTQTHRWSYHEYTLRGRHLVGVRHTYDRAADNFRATDRFSLLLPGADA